MPQPDADPEGVTERTEMRRVTETTENGSIEENSLSSLSSSVISVLSGLSVTGEEVQRVGRAMDLTCRARPWQRALFRVVRVLHGLDVVQIRQAPPELFRDLVRLWRDRADIAVPLEAVFGEFLAGWEKVRFPIGRNPLARVMARIRDFPAEAAAYEGEESRQLVAICRALQEEAGDGPFYLSCRVAADALGLDRMDVHRRLRVLRADGLLQVVKPGTKTRATRYRYLGDTQRTRAGPEMRGEPETGETPL